MSLSSKPSRLGLTPWQTVGPFFHYALPWEGGNDLITPKVEGTRMILRGRVLDADGVAVPDAMVEIWQANAMGRYNHPEDRRFDRALDNAFLGFGRCPTDDDGSYSFHTVKPGCVPGPENTTQAPHIAIGLFGRGLLRRLVTRAYFPESSLNETDPVLGLVESDRVPTLMASPEAAIDGVPVYRFDLHLQGDQETVFFDV